MGHSDNITYRVEVPDGALYLLRLHQPSLNIWKGVRQLPEFIASELAWLEALAEGGFPVQHPMRTHAGDLVASLQPEGAPLPESGPLPATLLTWQAGRHFTAQAPDAEAQIEQFGGLVGRLHDFSSGWSPPAGFARPSYDEDHFRRIFARLLRGVDLEVFSQENYWTLRAACREILRQISLLPAQPETWGMIHADLHVGNFLVCYEPQCHEPRIIPIDFSFCGFGHYLYDLSVVLAGGLSAALRPAFLRGYRAVRPLPDEAMRIMDAYALAGKLSYFAYQIDNPSERAWLMRRIPEVVQKDCARFLSAVASAPAP